jgi:molybdopterin synthase catalytic subunit
MSVSVRAGDFDIAAEIDVLVGEDRDIGAVVSFTGLVREMTVDGAITGMELEHYPGMTEAAIEAMIDQAFARFDIRAARVVHRIGVLAAREQIVLVAVTSAHRGEAFQACEFLMDYLKTNAPFWKKEATDAGARWVDARVADDAALARWGIEAANAAPEPPPVEG